MKVALALILPMAMFGVAVSFFTLVISSHEGPFVWPYAVVMVVLTILNLWNARVRHH
jgi:hypothetical protein